MNKSGRLITAAFAAALFFTATSNAVTISILSPPSVFGGANLSVTTASDLITLSDSHNQHSRTTWAITSATSTASGGVNVTYDFGPNGRWDSYSSFGTLAFEILSDSGSTTPEAVTLDVFGSSFYRHQLELACCLPVPQRVSIEGGGQIFDYEATNNGTWDVLDESITLMTNTRYFFSYSNTQLVEGTPQGVSYMPTVFATQAEFDAWTSAFGRSGTISADSLGFFNYNLAVRPSSVPEPGTLSLLGLSLVGVWLARRRARLHARA
jgi:hypothetical protein